MRHALIVLIIAFILIASPIDTTNLGGSLDDQLDMAVLDDIALSADPGFSVDAKPYIYSDLLR